MSEQYKLTTPPGTDPKLAAALEAWLNMRYEAELAVAGPLYKDKRVQVTSHYNKDMPYGRTGTAKGIRLTLDPDHIYQVVVESDNDGKEYLVPRTHLAWTHKTRLEYEGERIKQEGLKKDLLRKFGDPKAKKVPDADRYDDPYAGDFRVNKELPADPKSKGPLTGKFVRVVNGVKLGYYLGLGFVTSHDQANDLVNVRMTLDNKVVQGFKASDLKVILE